MTTLLYSNLEDALAGSSTQIFVGTKARLLSYQAVAKVPEGARLTWEPMVESTKPGDGGVSVETWLDGDEPRRLVACVLPKAVSRHNCPARPHAIAKLLRSALKRGGRAAVVLLVDDVEHAFAAGCAVPRVLPEYSRKNEVSGKAKKESDASTVAVAFLSTDPIPDTLLDQLRASGEGIRLAARLVDMPTSELNTDVFVDELRTLAKDVGAEVDVLRGEELEKRGYGALWSVGKTALQPPSLVVLTHAPEGATKTIAWVGKGIVYDTGGLSLKGKAHMPGMKEDMGGAAAVAGAFLAAARCNYDQKLHAVFCLAENAIGPAALRPDDVITMLSGKTVEINNTDAEGRLVLGDGVAHAVAELKPNVIVDLATLTGAQLVATGRRHAAVVCNDEGLEQRAVSAGRASGDLVHPLPFVPEFYRAEFKSKVADLKNSVKDRSNAQSSCAAQFIAEHLGDFGGDWLHVDMAGPVSTQGRGTGYGVALLMELFVR